MIDEQSLLEFSRYFMDRRELEKDYLLNLMLKIMSLDKISTTIVFKGGTALNYFYRLNRFSEDLDFTCIYDDDINNTIKLINKRIIEIKNSYSLIYNIRKEKIGIINYDAQNIPISIRNEFFIEGPLYPSTGISHKIKLDISFRKDLIRKPEKPQIFVSRYKDIGTMLIYVMENEEILSEKLCAIVERDKARDIYDIYFLIKYINMKLDENMFNKKVVLRKLNISLYDVVDRITHFNEKSWKEELSYLIKDFPEIDKVKRFLIAEINDIT